MGNDERRDDLELQQLTSDLDQALVERQQDQVDHNQRTHSRAQDAADTAPFDAERQAGLDNNQDRLDGQQAIIDDLQSGRDRYQELLDHQHDELGPPSARRSHEPESDDNEQSRRLKARADAAERRADAALSRAQQAKVRAEKARQRASTRRDRDQSS